MPLDTPHERHQPTFGGVKSISPIRYCSRVSLDCLFSCQPRPIVHLRLKSCANTARPYSNSLYLASHNPNAIVPLSCQYLGDSSFESGLVRNLLLHIGDLGYHLAILRLRIERVNASLASHVQRHLRCPVKSLLLRGASLDEVLLRLEVFLAPCRG